jgi:CheY-like chemotaxis protein/ribosomal protein S25
MHMEPLVPMLLLLNTALLAVGLYKIFQFEQHAKPSSSAQADSHELDEEQLYRQAKEIVLKTQKASTSLLQRRLRIGYSRAARILDRLETDGVVSAMEEGTGIRQVFVERLRPKRILLIDPDALIREILKNTCLRKGAQCMELDHTKDIVQKVLDRKPDLVSLSVLFEGGNRFDALKELKADERTKHIPVFLLTNLVGEEHIQTGMQLGAVAYLIAALHNPDAIIDYYLRYLREHEAN